MGPRRTFRCFIIGVGSLPIQCGHILLDSGHEILGLISPDATVQQWAAEHTIPHYGSAKNLAEILAQQPFDYLFSIFNLTILDSASLRLARKLTINLHDALLPTYAGLNATSWALLHREREHGVTWHVVTEGIDTGDILKQARVPVADDDTTLTLNLKIYEAAIASFAELVTELATDRIQPRVQDLTRRTYFSRAMKPTPGGVIAFNQPAQALDTLVRTLYFGPAVNTLGSAKLVRGDKAVIVSEIKVLIKPSSAPEGTVTRIEHDFIQICAADYEIEIRRLTTLTGAPLTITEFATQFDLKVGDHLADLSAEHIAQIEKVEQATDGHETFWVKKIQHLEPLPFPYVRETRLAEPSSEFFESAVALPAIMRSYLENMPQEARANWLAAAFGAWQARVGDVTRMDVGFQAPEMCRMAMGLETLFSPYVPLRIEMGSETPIGAFVQEVAQNIESISKRKTFAHDIFARHPVLRAGAAGDGFTMPVVVQIGERGQARTRAVGSQLTFWISEEGTKCYWLADPKLVSEQTIHAAGASFQVFLQAAAEQPKVSIVRLPLVPPAEFELLQGLNRTAAEYPGAMCVHQLFEEHAARTPDKTAVVFQADELSYRELNKRANQLAHFLVKNGIGPETIVGLAVDRSCDMVVGILGVLKAGGAYVPLDPNYPPARIQFMLEDAAPQVLVTQAQIRPELPTYDGKVICLDSDWSDIALNPTTNPGTSVTTENLAYIIYTSGSTGTPKGVMTHHAAVVNALEAETQRLRLTSNDRFPAVSSLSFDASVLQILQPLTHGASVVIADSETMRDGVKLAELLDSSGATVLDTTPVSLREMIDTGWQGSPTLKLNIGSDVLERELAEELLDRAAEVWNAYGLTEITIESIAYRVTHANGSVPVGQPMQNSTVYVLDAHLQRLPVGVPGELFLGGVGVARGYLNRPELTRERFLANPFENERDQVNGIPSAPTIFKTGDRGRYLPDGNLEFLGRADRQVKLRGFRIEPGEIEAALRAQPNVHEAVVIRHEDRPGQIKLVAYLIAEAGAQLEPAAMRSALGRVLPNFMVPSAFVSLDHFPISPNGKIDRRALPPPPLQNQHLNAAENEFRNATERQLASIWGNVLRVRPISPTDNFFELGGQSLIATRMFSQIQKEMGHKLPIATLFRAPTVRELAHELHAPSEKSRARTLVAIQPDGSRPPFFFVHGFGGGVVGFAKLAKLLGPEQPFYGLQAYGLDAGEEPDQLVETMAARYVEAMHQVQPQGPYHIGGYCYGGVVAFEMARQLERAGEKVGVLAVLEGYAVSYDNARKQLLRPRGLVRFVRNLPYWMMDYGPRRYAHERALRQKHTLPAEQRELIQSLQSSHLVNPEEYLPSHTIPSEQLRVRVAHASAMEQYQPNPFHGHVTLFRVRALSLTRCYDKDLGWGKVAASVEIRMLRGNHHNILERPYVEHLAEELGEVLENSHSV